MTGLFTDGALFGGVVAFSAVLDAEDVVGRIIRAKKPSSAGAVCGRLCLDDCFFSCEGGGPRDGRLCDWLSVDGLRVRDFGAVAVLARLGDRDTGGCACREFVAWEFPDARLEERLEAVGCGDAIAVLEPEEAVCAVKEAGSLIGLVGDRGLGLTKPVCGGEGGIRVFAEAP